MAQQSVSPVEFAHEFHADSDQHVASSPDRPTAWDPTDLQDRSAGRPATTLREQISTRTIRQVTVLGVGGRLSHNVENLGWAIQLALADEPRGVVCELSAAREREEPVAVEMLATAGRHVRNWPAIPVVVACPDPQVREALHAHPLGRHLIVSESLFCAVSAVLAAPALTVERLRLAPHPTGPNAARNFVTQTLLNWRLKRVAPLASQVASALVASSSVNAGMDIDLSLAWNQGALRLTVRDKGPGLPGQAHSGYDLHRPGLNVTAELSRAFGVLPTANGGTVVWAVLDAPARHRQPASTAAAAARVEPQEALKLNDVRSTAGQHSRRILERSQR